MAGLYLKTAIFLILIGFSRFSYATYEAHYCEKVLQAKMNRTPFLDFYKQIKEEDNDPHLTSDVQGATEETVAALEKISGQKLPPFYRNFLLTMGETKPITIPLGEGSSAQSIIWFYKNWVQTGKVHLPQKSVVISFDTDGKTFVLMNLESGADGPIQHRSFDGKVIHGVSDSFEKFLYRDNFFHSQFLMSGNVTLEAQNATLSIAKIRKSLMESGFREEWFSDSIVFCGSFQKTKITVEEKPSGKISVRICSLHDDNKEADNIKKMLLGKFPNLLK